MKFVLVNRRTSRPETFCVLCWRWWGSKFCKRRCKQAHLREIMLDRRRTIHRWCGFVARISLGRQAIPMIPRCARNSLLGAA